MGSALALQPVGESTGDFSLLSLPNSHFTLETVFQINKINLCFHFFERSSLRETNSICIGESGRIRHNIYFKWQGQRILLGSSVSGEEPMMKGGGKKITCVRGKDVPPSLPVPKSFKASVTSPCKGEPFPSHHRSLECQFFISLRY